MAVLCRVPTEGRWARGWGGPTPLPCTTGPVMGRNPWTSFNPCLPLKSRGHLLLAVIPLLLFCCYRFYHYKFYFTFISNKTGRRGGQTVGREWRNESGEVDGTQWQSCSGWKPSTFCFSFAKKKKKTVWGFFIVYYCCCCCLIQASPTTLIALSKAPLSV